MGDSFLSYAVAIKVIYQCCTTVSYPSGIFNYVIYIIQFLADSRHTIFFYLIKLLFTKFLIHKSKKLKKKIPYQIVKHY